MADELKVYLDHHILRDDFLYNRADNKMSRDTPDPSQILRLKDLYGDKAMHSMLRKPDFQRATWAWTPKECVSLLESMVDEQVIPSIIMWLSPEKRWYVLDGGHRISVVLAWLRDDWGDKAINLYKGDNDLKEKIDNAANAVYLLMEEKGIEKFDNYRLSYERLESSPLETREFEEEMGSKDTKNAQFYRGIISGSIGFPLQWVKGDYKKAEESFLKINSSGRSLTDWERKLVENRNSSFARVVMSTSNITRAEHCWPAKFPHQTDKPKIKHKIEEILDGTTRLHQMLYEPPQDPSFARIQQPIFAEPKTEPDKKPAYLAELLTIIKGGKGQEAQTERLLKQDQHSSSAEHLINNGLKLIKESLDILSHISGNTSHSLALVPALYFYAENGKYVRGLLYGFIYWLFIKDDQMTTINKKLLFSVYRVSFEQVLIATKKEIVNSFGRKIGSGAEITLQVAKFYENLLALLMKYNGDVRSEAFVEEYEEQFAQKVARSANIKPPYIDLPRCSVCNALIDVTANEKYNANKQEENSFYAHPFCIENFEMIKQIASGQYRIDLNLLKNQKTLIPPQQLTFLEFEKF